MGKKRGPSPFADDARLSGLEKVKPVAVRRLRAEFPGLPEDYLTFLETVGFGSIDSNFMIYSGGISPTSVYDPESAAKLGDLVLFGDDYQGYCSGFDPKDRWRVVEVDPMGMATNVTASTFTEFLADLLESMPFRDDTAPPQAREGRKQVKKRAASKATMRKPATKRPKKKR